VVLDDVRAVYLTRCQALPGGSHVQPHRQHLPGPLFGIGESHPGLPGRRGDAQRDPRKRAVQRFTPETITTAAELRADLEQVRTAGYATEREEFEAGTGCVAAPIRDARASPSPPSACPARCSASSGRRPPLGALVMRHADEISRVLGFRTKERGRRRAEPGLAAR
jgi:DNA-binding IclR family transcriptional regulator